MAQAAVAMAAARVVATAEVVEVVVVVTVGEMVGGRMAMVVRKGPTFALWCTRSTKI